MEDIANNSCRSEGESVSTEGEMPRDGKKGRRRQGCISSSDITLQDFADSSRPQACNRIKKSVIGATATSNVNKASGVQILGEQETEDLDWFDKDFDTFVIPEHQEGEEEDLTVKELAAERAERNNKKTKEKKNNDEGIVYPSDLWFHLSNFIDPLDVGLFASICQGTNAVTKTAAFWRQLYYRCYRNWTEDKKRKDSLPGHLKPTGIEKLNGLRARVISALFHFHQPLVERVQSKGPMDAEPHDLTGYRCLLAWHQPGARGWHFCFKLQKPTFIPRKKSSTQDLYYGYNDIFDNPEDGCCVLQVMCIHFASVPPVMGLLLKQVYMTLSAGFRHHRLRLHFDSSISSGTSSVSDIVANLDDVIGVKVIRWWHPTYPFIP